jgi:hypothetical protein
VNGQGGAEIAHRRRVGKTGLQLPLRDGGALAFDLLPLGLDNTFEDIAHAWHSVGSRDS